MSFIIDLGAKVRSSSLPSAVKHLLLTLGLYANEEGVCWPSRETLALDMSVDASTVSRNIKLAKSLGVLSSKRRLGRTALYTLHLEAIEVRSDVAKCNNRMSQNATSNVANRHIKPRKMPLTNVAKPAYRTLHKEFSIELSKGKEEEEAREATPPRYTRAPVPPPPPNASVSSSVGLKDLSVEYRPDVSGRKPEHPVDLQRWCARWLNDREEQFPKYWRKWACAVLPYLDDAEREHLLAKAVGDRSPNLPWLTSIVTRICTKGIAQHSARGRSPNTFGAGNNGLFTGGRNPRVSATAINQPDDPYRNSGSPTVYVPPAIAAMAKRGDL